jgi:hypothetical protein
VNLNDVNGSFTICFDFVFFLWTTCLVLTSFIVYKLPALVMLC